LARGTNTQVIVYAICMYLPSSKFQRGYRYGV
jgi:hypothetical protein